jgi:hypothetical protein
MALIFSLVFKKILLKKRETNPFRKAKLAQKATTEKVYECSWVRYEDCSITMILSRWNHLAMLGNF